MRTRQPPDFSSSSSSLSSSGQLLSITFVARSRSPAAPPGYFHDRAIIFTIPLFKLPARLSECAGGRRRTTVSAASSLPLPSHSLSPLLPCSSVCRPSGLVPHSSPILPVLQRSSPTDRFPSTAFRLPPTPLVYCPPRARPTVCDLLCGICCRMGVRHPRLLCSLNQFTCDIPVGRPARNSA